MNNYLIHIFVLFLPGIVLPVSKDSIEVLNGFRNFEWGTSTEYVEKNEPLPLLQSFEGFGIYALSYEGKIAGHSARIDYTFRDNKLVEGSYVIKDVKNFAKVFNDVQAYVVDSYGEPDFWSNTLINSDSLWIQVDSTENYRGPELYWKFANGFISLLLKKFEAKVSLYLLHVWEKSISDYGREGIELNNFQTDFP